MSERTAQAMGHFRDKGWTQEQAAGIVGNLIQESSLNTGARNEGDGSDGTDGIGVAQWNSDRARSMKAFAASKGADWTDFRTQLDFVDHELRTSEAAAGNRLKNAATVEDATSAMIGFERPQGWSVDNPRNGHGWGNRLNNARQALGLEPLAINEPTIAATAATPEPGTMGPPQIPSYRMTTPLQTEDLYVRDPGAYDADRDGPADDRGWTRPMLDAAAEQQTLSWIWDHVSDNTRYDPNFSLDEGRLETDLKDRGLDAGFYADWFSNTRSESHYQNLLASAKEDQERAAALDADGAYGTFVSNGIQN